MAVLDIYVISPLQDLTLYAAVFTPGHALNVGVQRKMEAHLSDCRAAGMDFVPIVVETLGRLNEDASLPLGRLGRPPPNVLYSPDNPFTIRFFTP